MRRAGLALVTASLLVASCSAPPETGLARAVKPPPVTGSFDYQLGGPYDVPGFAVVARDLTAEPVAGAYDICYVNGFQTQPGEGGNWLRRYGQAVLRDGRGTPVVDSDWPDEYVLDPSTPAQRAIILTAIGPLITDCATKGFDAVDIDNFDTFTRFSDPSTGRVDRAGAVELARSFAALAHENGLAIGQKNAAEISETGHREVGFDFAIAEECAAYRECEGYTREYGAHVLQIEYSDNLPAPFDEVCRSPDRARLTILRDRNLVPRGTAGYVYEQCR